MQGEFCPDRFVGFLDLLQKRAGGGMAPLSNAQKEVRDSAGSSDAIKNALAAGSGAFGLAFLLRLLANVYRDSGPSSSQVKTIQSYINARNPVVSIDPSTKDNKSEEKERQLGSASDIADTSILEESGLSKEASIDIPDIARKIYGGLKSGIRSGFETGSDLYDKTKVKDSTPWWALVALISAVGAGGYAGKLAADTLEGTETAAEVKEATDKKRNKLDKLVYDEYVRTRGLSKTASGADSPESGENASLINSIKVAAPLVALLAGTFAFVQSKKYYDNKDPNRKLMADLNTYMRHYSKMTARPPRFINGSTAIADLEDGSLTAKPHSKTGRERLPDQIKTNKEEEFSIV